MTAGIQVDSRGLNFLRGHVESRHSVRAFKRERVERSLIQSALEVAFRSPSWCNTQPWHVVVTDADGTEDFRRALSDHAAAAAPEPDFPFPASYTGVYHERRLETALRLYDAVGIPRGDRSASGRQTAKNFELFGAPHVAIISTERELGVYGAVDCGVFLGNLLLALRALGLGAVPQAALAAFSPFVRDWFDLPDSRSIVCGVSFGWEDEADPANAFRTPRASTHHMTTWVDQRREAAHSSHA
jgi:nitroreductase